MTFTRIGELPPGGNEEELGMDCGVAGYDNTFGLPPFFPTRLRFEDYIYRLWIQQAGVAAAHVDSAQHHTRSNYMRNPPAAEIFNEELTNLLKWRIYASVSRLDELSIAFDYEGEVTALDAEEILSKIVRLHERAPQQAETATSLNGARRCGCLPPIWRRHSTLLSLTFFSRTS